MAIEIGFNVSGGKIKLCELSLFNTLMFQYNVLNLLSFKRQLFAFRFDFSKMKKEIFFFLEIFFVRVYIEPLLTNFNF